MRTARKLVLLAAMALAALALTATSASAQVEVSDEATETHCPAVEPANHTEGDGGCVIFAQSLGQVEFGSPAGMTLCDNEFEARIDENGGGYFYSKLLENCNIPMVPCVEAEGPEEWPVQLLSSTLLEFEYCLDVGGGAIIVRCDLEWDVTILGHDEVLFDTGGAHRDCAQAGFTVEGAWSATSDAAHPGIEISDI